MGALCMMAFSLACSSLACSSLGAWNLNRGPAAVQLKDAPDGALCTEASRDLRVRTVAGALVPEREYALSKHEQTGGRNSATEYLGVRGERIALECCSGAESVRVRVEYFTDYGEFFGVIDRANSSAHWHGEALCLELLLKRGDGSEIVEQMSVSLPSQ